MKKYTSLMAVIPLAASANAQTLPASSGQAPVQSLTLQEAVRIALQKNSTIQAAGAYAQAVQRGITAAKAFR